MFPEVDTKALSRQIFELVRYGRFSWSDVMNMPITTRRRQHFLLTRYAERDNAASSGKTNLPAIEMEDHVSSVVDNLKSVEDGVPVAKPDTKVKGNLPPAVQEALDRMEKEKQEKDGSQGRESLVKKSESNQSKKPLVITVPEYKKFQAETSVKSSNIEKEDSPKPAAVEGNLPKEAEPETLEAASKKLKYKKVEVPKELLNLMKKKSGRG